MPTSPGDRGATARFTRPLRRRSEGARGRGSSTAPPPRPPGGVPWFRAHPGVAAAVISVSSVAILAVQFLDKEAANALALLYVLPVGLAAVTFGTVGGLAAAAAAYVAFGLFAVFSSADQVGFDGWIGRAAAIFLLGGLLGRASDQTERATLVALDQERRRLLVEEKNRRYREGIELSDSILQHVAAAKWAIEQGDDDQAVKLLTRALSSGQDMVAELLPTQAPARRAPGAPSPAADQPPTSAAGPPQPRPRVA